MHKYIYTEILADDITKICKWTQTIIHKTYTCTYIHKYACTEMFADMLTSTCSIHTNTHKNIYM